MKYEQTSLLESVRYRIWFGIYTRTRFPKAEEPGYHGIYLIFFGFSIPLIRGQI